MLEDIWVILLELDNVIFFFKQLDENYVVNINVFYYIEGSWQVLKVIFYFDSYYFFKLFFCLEGGVSLRLYMVLFMKVLENVEGLFFLGSQVVEDLQQEINVQFLEKVQQYYCKFRVFYLEWFNLFMDVSIIVVKIDQFICFINVLDEFCCFMKFFVYLKFGVVGSVGVGFIFIFLEFCYCLGVCQMVMCGMGMQRSILSVFLEQVVILVWSYGLLFKCIMQVMDIMWKQGLRVEILVKNL